MPDGITRRNLLVSSSLAGLAATVPPAFAAMKSAGDPLQDGFSRPPASAAPWTYWYWISENISKPGISRDLEVMADVGISEALLGVIADAAPSGSVTTLGEPFWQAVVHAMEEGERTGVGVGLFNSPGWSQSGGPWVKPEDAMRYIASSELRVTGPTRLTQAPLPPCSPFQDVALQAFPAPKGETEFLDGRLARIIADPPIANAGRLLDRVAPDSSCQATTADAPPPDWNMRGNGSQQFDILAEKPYSARSLQIRTRPSFFYAKAVLSWVDDHGKIRPIRSFEIDRRNALKTVGPMRHPPVVIAFPLVRARQFRLTLTEVLSGPDSDIAGIHLSGGARLEAYIEKQLGKMHQTPLPPWDAYHWPPSPEPEDTACCVDPAAIVDLTARMAPDGRIDWEVPPGEWIVLRSGMALTHVTNAPAPPASTGLEVDKMKVSALEQHFDAYVGTLLRRLSKRQTRHAFRRVVADSYEAGSQNWTDDFPVRFLDAYDYDPREWLPVLTGRIVGSADQSDRFLWDLRRLVADLISKNYVGALKAISARHGLGLWLENYGHWGFPGEFMQYGGAGDRIAGEFWVDGLGAIETVGAATTAAAYGKPIVSAEAFTGGKAWAGYPDVLKTRGDWAFARGINHFVLHVNIHQPDERKPGINAWFGTEFNRNNLWFPKSRSWIDYIRRTSFLLQQGQPVADLGYFIGEDAPVMQGPSDPAPPPGHQITYVNAELIETRLTVRNGRFVTPEGHDFAVLVLPPLETMRPALLRRIQTLVAAGGILAGTPPTRSPSMAAFPGADAEVAARARELWQSPRIFLPDQLPVALAAAGVQPSLQGSLSSSLLWNHRKLADGDLFFLSNQSNETMPISASVRAIGPHVQLWDAVSGAVLNIQNIVRTEDRSLIELTLPPQGACIVTFRQTDWNDPLDRAPAPPSAFNTISIRESRELVGPWQVHFPAIQQPDRIFTQLRSWSEHEDPAIHYFSGTAIYRKHFTLTLDQLRRTRLALDLGTVSAIAEVRINGRFCGTVWTSPSPVDINAACKAGDNLVEILVTSTWYNRLLGQQKMGGNPPGINDAVWTAIKPELTSSNPTMSGLVGPVHIHIFE